MAEKSSVIILPETEAAALERAEAIRERISQISVRFRSDALSQLTISIGLAAFPNSGETLEELLRAADGALYSKAYGRNQVVAARPEVATV